MLRLNRFPLLVLLVVLTGCAHDDPTSVNGGGDGAEPTLASIEASIFRSSCAVSGCHLGSSAPEGLDLSAGNARSNLVGVPSGEVPDFLRVDPGNADDSYLVMKLEGDARIAGARMPLNRSALPASDIQVIRDWIDGGAQ